MDLQNIFRPESIAIVGASPNATGSRTLVHNLRLHGYQGAIYPVNPKYTEFEGMPCYPSLAALPSPPQAVAINVSAERTLEALKESGRCGAKAAVVFGVGFGESGSSGTERQAELIRTAREFNMAVVGPNCMGVIAPAYGASIWTGSLHPLDRLSGEVGLISHSGSVAIAFLFNGRFGFSLVASSGNEAVVQTSDLLAYYAGDPKTRIIALFLETIRSPERFRVAALQAHRAGKPIVALKVGKSEQAARNVASHSGALAGSHRTTSALLRSLGICEVDSMEEMAETIAALQCTRVPTGGRFGVTHGSGGEASLLLDLAIPLGLTFPPLEPRTRDLVRPVWGDTIGIGNPLDVWGAMPYTQSYPICLNALADQPDIDVLILDQDAPVNPPDGLPDAPYRTPMNVATFAAATAQRINKPLFYVSNLAGGVHSETKSILDQAGIPLLLGLHNGLKGIAHWQQFHRWQVEGAPALHVTPSLSTALPNDLVQLLDQTGPLNEVQSKQLLQGFGLPAPRERFCLDPASAAIAAAEIGFPVAVKVVGRSLTHKTEVGGVHLGLQSEAAVAEVCQSLMDRLGQKGLEGFLVAEMVSGGREFILGLARDPQYGLTVVCGSGGIMAEVFADVAVRIPPISPTEADRMIAGLKASRMLGEWRGRPAADVTALRDAILALSRFAEVADDRVIEVDINPLIVHPNGRGVTMVDALVVLAPKSQVQE